MFSLKSRDLTETHTHTNYGMFRLSRSILFWVVGYDILNMLVCFCNHSL